MENRAMIQRSLDYIEENLRTEVTAAELAEMAHISLFYYYRQFQQATGLPVMQYILRRRLLHGVYAINQGSSKIDAALLYGFDTYAGFYKAFCREFGSTPSEFLKSCRAKRPYRIDLTKEEHMTVTHKKAAQILKYWNLEGETITDIYYEGTGNKNDSACYVGEDFVLKYTANLGKLKNHIEVSKAIKSIGLLSASPVTTIAGQEYIQDGELYFYVTRRIKGMQMVSHHFGDGDARFVGEIIGQLHLALNKIEDCVSEAGLLATVRDWALPNAKQALGLTDAFHCIRSCPGRSSTVIPTPAISSATRISGVSSTLTWQSGMPEFTTPAMRQQQCCPSASARITSSGWRSIAISSSAMTAWYI